MPYRTFIDSLGTEWQVWDIVPLMTERRSESSPERRAAELEVPLERRSDDRRLVDDRRADLRGWYSQGWLCFESSEEKRRFSPIPPDWTTCSESTLESYLRGGERVSAAHRAVNFNDEQPFAEAG